MSYFRLPSKKPRKSDSSAPARQPSDHSKSRKEKPKPKQSQHRSKSQKPKTQQQLTAKLPDWLLKLSEPVFKLPEAASKPSRSFLKPPEPIFLTPEAALKPSRSYLKPLENIIQTPEAALKPSSSLLKPPEKIFQTPEAALKPSSSLLKPPEKIFQTPEAALKPSRSFLKPPEPIFKTPGSVFKPSSSFLKPPEKVFQTPEAALKLSSFLLKPPEPIFKTPGSVFKAPEPIFNTPESALKPSRSFLMPGGSLFKPSQPQHLKRSGSNLSPPAIKKRKTLKPSSGVQQKDPGWPKPIGYNKGTLMYYGSVDASKKSSAEDSDDESADIDVVGFTDDSEENQDISSEDDSDDSNDSDDSDESDESEDSKVDVVVDVEDDPSVNMVIQPDPFNIWELVGPLAQRRQNDRSEETSDYGDDEDSEENVVAESLYGDNYLNDEGYADELDKFDEEYNMMDHVQFPINPSLEIARIVQSNLDRREALERIVAYL